MTGVNKPNLLSPKLKLYTARHGVYSGPGALDITRAGADKHPDSLGAVFAPSRWLLNVALGVPGARFVARGIHRCTEISDRSHSRAFVGWYEAEYRRAMEPVLRPQTASGREGLPSPALDALFSFADERDPDNDGSVTVLCFCENCAACHRVMFAHYLVELSRPQTL